MEERLWFGTRDYMRWIPAPLTGADMGAAGWDAGGTYLGGGGWQVGSWDSHKEYAFSWSEASATEMAMLLEAYRNGTYGRGLIYFCDPHAFERNVIPSRYADPSISADGVKLVRGSTVSLTPNSGWQANQLPIKALSINLTSVPLGFRGVDNAVFIPIPEGYTLALGAHYTAVGSGGVFATTETSANITGASTRLTPLAVDATSLVSHYFVGVNGVWLWIGKSSNAAASVTVSAMTGRLFKTGSSAPTLGPWVSGMGHSGVRFVGRPTRTATSGVNEGQAGYAATFRETGSWIYS